MVKIKIRRNVIDEQIEKATRHLIGATDEAVKRPAFYKTKQAKIREDNKTAAIILLAWALAGMIAFAAVYITQEKETKAELTASLTKASVFDGVSTELDHYGGVTTWASAVIEEGLIEQGAVWATEWPGAKTYETTVVGDPKQRWDGLMQLNGAQYDPIILAVRIKPGCEAADIHVNWYEGSGTCIDLQPGQVLKLKKPNLVWISPQDEKKGTTVQTIIVKAREIKTETTPPDIRQYGAGYSTDFLRSIYR